MIEAASIPALKAPSIAKQPIGTPFGICTIESRLSRPFNFLVSIGTPGTHNVVKGAMKNRTAIMSMSYGGNWFSIQTWFQNIPFRRIKAGVLKLGGMKTTYLRFYEVLPGMPKNKFERYMEKVKKLVRQL